MKQQQNLFQIFTRKLVELGLSRHQIFTIPDWYFLNTTGLAVRLVTLAASPFQQTLPYRWWRISRSWICLARCKLGVVRHSVNLRTSTSGRFTPQGLLDFEFRKVHFLRWMHGSLFNTSAWQSFPLYWMAFEMLPISANMYSICGDISVLKFRWSA
jgi:hypothetical protein